MRLDARLASIAATSAATLALAAVATSLALSQSGPETKRSDPEPTSTEVSEPKSVTRVFAAFREPRRSDDRVGPAEQRLLAGGIADIGMARRVGDASNTRHWAMPGENGSVCQISRGFAGCPSVAVVETAGVAPMLGYRAGIHYVSGIAVDGVSSVTLAYADGTSAVIPVVDNGFSIETEGRPTRLSWRGPRGPESFVFPDFAGEMERHRREAMKELGIPQGDAEAVRSVPRR